MGVWTNAAKLLAGLAVAGAPSAAPSMQPPSWPQQRSDIPADKAVLFGTLPNGMRYAVLRNTVPAGRVSIRFRIDAGSLNENDTQQGMAHYLEHMAFRGSARVKSGEALHMLERLGLSAGADANAFTGLTQTVYRFDIPSADAAKIDTALMLMRETASELTLSDADFDAERPVILSEERGSASPNVERAEAEQELLFHGQLAASRMPIGVVDLLRRTGPEPLRQFYRAFYRPERAALVVVGDVDPSLIEARIRDRFGDWRTTAPSAPDPDYGRPAATGPQARVTAAAGLSPRLSLAWVRPFDDSRRDKARLRRQTAEMLAMNILTRRLYALASSDNSPFASASAGSGNRARSGHVTMIGALITPDRWQRALQAIIIAQRQITASAGVSQADLDSAIATVRSGLQTRATSAPTRSTGARADELTASIDTDDVFTDDLDDLALFEQTARSITAEEVSAAARSAFSGGGPLIMLSGPSAVTSEEDVIKALGAAQAMPTSTVETATKSWPFTDFGSPGKVTDRHRVDDLDFTAVRLNNGVRLNVKQTNLVKDQILIAIRFGTGRQALRNDRAPSDWAIAGWLAGGLKGISLAEQQQIFAGKVHRENVVTGDDAYQVTAATRPADFALELQLLTAYMVAPAWRGEAFDRVRTVLGGMLPQLDTSPGGVMRRDLGPLLRSGDLRWSAPTQSEIAATHVDDARRLIEPQIAAGPLEITIVGDIAPDEAITQVAATFGTLSPKQDFARGTDRIAFPRFSHEPVTLRHNGRDDQGLAFVAWPIPDLYSDPDRARTLDLLSTVVSHRLFDQVRVAQGATYSTSASANASAVHPGYGYFSAMAETPPDKVQSFYDTLEAIIADLQSKEISADEFARARSPAIEQLATARRTNSYWLSRLNGSQREPRQLDLLRTVESGVAKISAADIQRVARSSLDRASIWRLRILPNIPASASAR